MRLKTPAFAVVNVVSNVMADDIECFNIRDIITMTALFLLLNIKTTWEQKRDR